MVGYILGLIISSLLKKRAAVLPVLAAILLMSQEAFSGVELQKTGSAKKNVQKGYDFYDSSGAKTGYSIPNRHKGYDFYDTHGNKVSSLKKEEGSKNSYTFRDSYGIRQGGLKKGASGEYLYKDTRSGKAVSSVPQVQGDIGSLSPEAFQGEKK